MTAAADDPAEDAAACVRLWRAALAAGLVDAAKGDAGARFWLASPDFRAVCELAGFNPDALRLDRFDAFTMPAAARRGRGPRGRRGGGRGSFLGANVYGAAKREDG